MSIVANTPDIDNHTRDYIDGYSLERNTNKHWCIDGKLHRKDGPAIEYADGTKKWYINGNLHRKTAQLLNTQTGLKNGILTGNFIERMVLLLNRQG